jgi:nucleotide-binding universal stress UspA family protein
MSQIEVRRTAGAQLKTILVATDLTAASENALAFAISIARHFQAKLYLLHVVSSFGLSLAAGEATATSSAVAQREAALLERKLIVTGKLQGLHFHVFVREGDVWQQTENIIRRECVDMVVLGTHGRTGIAKLVLGSVAEKISRLATCPVLTVGSQWQINSVEKEDGPVLFPTDFSDASITALPYAISMANHLDTKLVLLHLLSPIALPDDRSLYTAADIAIMKETAELAACDRLKDMASQPSVTTETACVVNIAENIPNGILCAAENCGARGIVMGLHRRKYVELTSHLPWSTAYDVMRGAECPVLTAKS